MCSTSFAAVRKRRGAGPRQRSGTLSKASDCSCCKLVSVDSVDLLQAAAHRPFQIVAGPTVFRVATGDILFLLPPQLARLLWRHLLGDGPDIRPLDLAIEIGEFGIGADRLFHLAAGGGAGG